MSDPGENTVVPGYEVVLLYPSMPSIQQAPLLAAMAHRCGTVELVEGAASAFRFPDLAPLEGGEPAGCALRIRNSPLPETEAEEALVQTRDWPQARAAFRSHRAYVRVTDREADQLPYKNRLRLFQDVLRSICGLAAPLAILWIPSGKLVSPLVLAKADPLLAAVNVRCGPAPDGSGAFLMDTLGLAPLGLPDFEVTFSGQEPSRMEPWLRALARYLFDLGDVLEDGRATKGPDGTRRWTFSRAPASEAPPRRVIRLSPSPDC